MTYHLVVVDGDNHEDTSVLGVVEKFEAEYEDPVEFWVAARKLIRTSMDAWDENYRNGNSTGLTVEEFVHVIRDHMSKIAAISVRLSLGEDASRLRSETTRNLRMNPQSRIAANLWDGMLCGYERNA